MFLKDERKGDLVATVFDGENVGKTTQISLKLGQGIAGNVAKTGECHS